MHDDFHCWVVPCVPCDNPYNLNEESPLGCACCGMLEWLSFPTEEEAVEAYKKQYPEQFEEDE